MAAKLASEGHLRRNGIRVARPSQDVLTGDILTIPLGTSVRLVEVLALPTRRGPAHEAQACYRVLDQSGESELGQRQATNIQGDTHP